MHARTSFDRFESDRGSDRGILAWLVVCAALVFAIIVVGGVTRLTHSGLSIVEWQPIVGAIPPLGDADWQRLFEKYQATPEYQRVNRGMGLAGFKRIFWWEYVHRLLGRLIGVVFLLPLVWFALRGRIERSRLPHFAILFVAGGLQGALGWYMVKSGLVDDPRVSHYRLTAHLGLAFAIYAGLVWLALDYWFGRARTFRFKSQQRIAGWLTALVFLMVLSGGLVAGIRAGKAYNTFPLMNGNLTPPEILMLEPWYRNFFDNMATVQFDHRLIAWLLAFFVPWFWWRARASIGRRGRLALDAWMVLLAIQIALGIATLLYVVPIPLAALHQAGAVLVFTAALATTHALR